MRFAVVMLVLVVVLVHDVLVDGVRVMVLFDLQRHVDEDAFFAGAAGGLHQQADGADGEQCAD